MKVYQPIIFFFKTNFIIWGLVFCIAITYGIFIQLLYIRPFVETCNTATEYTPEKYIKHLKEKFNNKNVNITNISPRFIEFDLSVPYTIFSDKYECTVWVDEKSQTIRDSEIENY